MTAGAPGCPATLIGQGEGQMGATRGKDAGATGQEGAG
jgi:hypothetical protein